MWTKLWWTPTICTPCAGGKHCEQAGHRVAMTAIHGAIGLDSADLLEHLLGEERDKTQHSAISAGHTAL